MKLVASAVKQGQWEIKDEKLLVAGKYFVDASDLDMQYKAEEGFDCASENGLLVSLDLNLDEELILEDMPEKLFVIFKHFVKIQSYI